jgi:predicted Fe-Mo cluster-binding NifX family protein
MSQMRVAVPSRGPDLDAQVDSRFGRCAYFLFVETDDMTFHAVENTNAGAESGAGIRAAQIVSDNGAETLLAGNCGPNAFRALQAAGVAVIVGVSGTVREAVEDFKKGRYKAGGQANVEARFGAAS